MRTEALLAEPRVTAALRPVIDGAGGQLVDFDLRIKSASSVMSKLRRERKKAVGIGHPIRAVADVLRYKVVVGFERYEEARRQIVGELEGLGFTVFENKDGWGTRYPGHNLKLRSPDGYAFELQFQTPESHEANKRTHGLYRRMRVAKPEEASALEQRILEITRPVATPPGVRGARP